MEDDKKRDPFKGASFKGTPVSKQEYLDAYDSYVKRCSGSSLQIGSGCEIKQTSKGIYIDGVKQKGAIDLQIKKNSDRWTEVQITYMAHTFKKEKY